MTTREPDHPSAPGTAGGRTRPTTGRTRPGAAFFDVDETLIAVKSMFRFLRYHLAAIGSPPAAYSAVTDELRGLVAAGASREEVMRAYYRVYAGQRAADLSATGRDWFRHELGAGDLFLPAGLRAFREHGRRGDLTVLVSGSFAPCLDPLADRLGATAVLATRLETVDGVHTGELVTLMLGRDKADATRAFLREHGIAPADCSAYGDHASDLPMLLAVGDPVVVGDDPELVRHAAARGWRRLPGREGSPSAGTTAEDGAGISPDRPRAGWHR
ncbi:HAD-IB family hydrolase [Streptomyces populi]|uniref:HAD-IB family hydrolase n=1 Tax=Streptomyces populi TaxID=2058924 RepID=A0A2I0SKI1_9ACTN|nr:HAD family hydrolase [Streptomyces populi]PKT70411.1 HAD-IB family hydrolase [Streptomyces populi]